MLCSYDSINIGRFIYPPALVGYMEETTYMDIEPSWEDIAPMFCEWLENGTDEQKALARSEIQKMAKAAAFLRAEQKALGHNDGPQNQPDEEPYPGYDCDMGEEMAERETERAWAAERERAAEYATYGDFY